MDPLLIMMPKEEETLRQQFLITVNLRNGAIKMSFFVSFIDLFILPFNNGNHAAIDEQSVISVS